MSGVRFADPPTKRPFRKSCLEPAPMEETFPCGARRSPELRAGSKEVEVSNSDHSDMPNDGEPPLKSAVARRTEGDQGLADEFHVDEPFVGAPAVRSTSKPSAVPSTSPSAGPVASSSTSGSTHMDRLEKRVTEHMSQHTSENVQVQFKVQPEQQGNRTKENSDEFVRRDDLVAMESRLNERLDSMLHSIVFDRKLSSDAFRDMQTAVEGLQRTCSNIVQNTATHSHGLSVVSEDGEKLGNQMRDLAQIAERVMSMEVKVLRSEAWLQTYFETFEKTMANPEEFLELGRYSSGDMAATIFDNKVSDQTEIKSDASGPQRQSSWTALFKFMVAKDNMTAQNFITIISFALIMTNAASLALIEDVRMHAVLSGTPPPQWIDTVELTFVFLFVIEIIARLFVFRGRFFGKKERWWNLFDFLLVLSAIFERISEENANLSFARTLRILRLVRAMKIFHVVEHLRTLRIVAAMIGNAFTAVCWALLFGGMFAYVGAVFFMSRLSTYLEKNEMSESDLQAVHKYFGRFSITISSILAATSGGISWLAVTDPLHTAGWDCYVLWVLLVLFVVFGLMNLLTAIVVEATGRQAELDRENANQQLLCQEASRPRRLIQLFEEADGKDGEKDGLLSEEEMRTHLADDDVVEHLANIGVRPADAWHVFELVKSDGKVNMEEYVSNLLHWQGPAKSVDVAKVLAECKKNRAYLKKYEQDQSDLIRKALRNSRLAAAHKQAALDVDHDHKQISKERKRG